MQYIRAIFLLLLFVPSIVCGRTFEVTISGGVMEAGTVEIEEGTGVAALLNSRRGVYVAGCPRGIVFSHEEGGPLFGGKERAFKVDVCKIVEEDLEDFPVPEGYEVIVPEHLLPCVNFEEFNRQLADYVRRRNPKKQAF